MTAAFEARACITWWGSNSDLATDLCPWGHLETSLVFSHSIFVFYSPSRLSEMTFLVVNIPDRGRADLKPAHTGSAQLRSLWMSDSTDMWPKCSQDPPMSCFGNFFSNDNFYKNLKNQFNYSFFFFFGRQL